MIVRIISGGQIGADIAALRAAKAIKIPTGGHAPKGYRTLKGSNLDLRDLYGLKEHRDSRYPPRTEQNVYDSDGTIRFAFRFDSPGERCTAKWVRFHHKPCFDVPCSAILGKHEKFYGPHRAVGWIRKHNIEVLNVAGNADPRIEPIVESYLTELVALLAEEEVG